MVVLLTKSETSFKWYFCGHTTSELFTLPELERADIIKLLTIDIRFTSVNSSVSVRLGGPWAQST
jgi:hypothetical protein